MKVDWTEAACVLLAVALWTFGTVLSLTME